MLELNASLLLMFQQSAYVMYVLYYQKQNEERPIMLPDAVPASTSTPDRQLIKVLDMLNTVQQRFVRPPA